MALIGLFDPFDDILGRDFASVEAFVTEWDRHAQCEVGPAYVYAFRDADGSVFYIGKGTGDRAHDAEKHHHGRLGYYVAKMLGAPYTVQKLKSGLSADDAEVLEGLLIQKFGRQLVNWAGQWPQDADDAVADPSDSPPTTELLPTYAQTRELGQMLRKRAREAATRSLEEAASICHEALTQMSRWEEANADAQTRALQRRAAIELGARVDLHMARHQNAARPPVPACDILSDLTIYLCRLGRAEEARREVEAFGERYPHGLFREFDIFDNRSGLSTRIPVAKRERATLQRIEHALLAKRSAEP